MLVDDQPSTSFLAEQLSELEALKSMYPEDGAVVFTPGPEQDTLWFAQRVADRSSAARATDVESLSGLIRLQDLRLFGEVLALRFVLPQLYPSTPPHLSVDTAAPRHIHEVLCQAVAACVDAANGELCLIAAVSALQDAAQHLLDSGQVPAAAAEPSLAALTQRHMYLTSSTSLLRILIWFHHIKSTTKRKHIVDWARELRLGGGCKPGFPGIVVAEGAASDVREFVARVRALSWQAMQIRAEEEVPAPSSSLHALTEAALAGVAKFSSTVQNGPGVCNRSGLDDLRQLPLNFTEFEETGMSALGQMCTAAGLEELFLTGLKLNKSLV